MHFVPTSSSWLNLVERWFKELTDRRLRRGGAHERRRTQQRDRNLGRATGTTTVHLAQDGGGVEKVRRGRAALGQVKPATRH